MTENPLLDSYGKIIFDLCRSMLSTQTHAQTTFRSIFKTLQSTPPARRFFEYERAWVLKTVCDRLLAFYPHAGRKVSAEEQIRLDANGNVNARFESFHSFFDRLRPEDQLLLLLREKHKIPLSEISMILGTPEGSLKVRRQLSLKHLEEWIWNIR